LTTSQIILLPPKKMNQAGKPEFEISLNIHKPKVNLI